MLSIVLATYNEIYRSQNIHDQVEIERNKSYYLAYVKTYLLWITQ